MLKVVSEAKDGENQWTAYRARASIGNSGLITSRRESRSIIYSANYEHMQRLLDFLLENCCSDNGGKC